MGPPFLVHNCADTVGVIVVEDVRKGQSLTGLVMDTEDAVTLKALDDVPLGHRIALENIKNNETVVKYGHNIGRAVAPITLGRHVHVHNVKTKRW
ncbi:MAG: flagellar biosynthesis protein FlgA [Alphaproteobacteria bacterium]|nr:flagellar biosynthesis protein FlgA [Alphaproteobacteria bacterium]